MPYGGCGGGSEGGPRNQLGEWVGGYGGGGGGGYSFPVFIFP